MSNTRTHKSPFANEDDGTDSVDLSAFATLGLLSIDVKSLLIELDVCVSRYERGSVRLDAISASVMGAKLLSAKLPYGRVTKIAHDPILQATTAAKPFLVLFDLELARLLAFQRSRAEELKASALVLLRATDGAIARVWSGNEDDVRFRERADALSSRCISMYSFIRKCISDILPVAMKADKSLRIGSRCMEAMGWAIKAPRGDLIAIMSHVYSNIKVIEERFRGGSGYDVGSSSDSDKLRDTVPTNLERRSHKFWVKNDKLIDIMLTAVKEVPLTVFGKCSRCVWEDSSGTRSSDIDTDRLLGAIATPINSVYFDGDTLPLYTDRLAQTEGAQLLRIWWYGDHALGKNDVVFLELKMHHESWVGLKSIKRRVSILEKDVDRLVDFGSTTGCDDEGHDPTWSKEQARDIVSRASPQMTGDELDTTVNLLLECRQVIVLKQLRPCIRMMYSRITFQSIPARYQVEPQLRLTLDTKVTFVDERRGPMGPSIPYWRLPDDADLDAQRVARLPCGVLEVKVTGKMQDGGDLPPFLNDLLDSGALVDANKFSKYLTATAAFHNKEVATLPYWAELPLFQPLFKGDGCGSENFSSREKGGEVEYSVGSGAPMSLQLGLKKLYSRPAKVEVSIVIIGIIFG